MVKEEEPQSTARTGHCTNDTHHARYDMPIDEPSGSIRDRNQQPRQDFFVLLSSFFEALLGCEGRAILVSHWQLPDVIVPAETTTASWPGEMVLGGDQREIYSSFEKGISLDAADG